MLRKVLYIGNSQGVSIPAAMLKKLSLSAGSEVDIRLDELGLRIVIESVKKKKYPIGVDREFLSQLNGFIKKYHTALTELSKK